MDDIILSHVENIVPEQSGNPLLRLNPYGINGKYLKFLKKTNGSLSLMAKLIGDIYPINCGYTEESSLWILPYRGPRLIEGEFVPNNNNYTIKKIHYDYNNECYILELIEK